MPARAASGRGLPPAGGRAGFTLIELVLVLSIVVVLAGLAAPRYAESMANYRLDAAARRVAADLAHARQTAQATSSSTQLTFDTVRARYKVVGVRALDARTTGFTVSVSEAPYHAMIRSADFGGDATVAFDGYGVPDSGGSVVLQVGGRTRTVTLDGHGKVLVGSTLAATLAEEG